MRRGGGDVRLERGAGGAGDGSGGGSAFGSTSQFGSGSPTASADVSMPRASSAFTRMRVLIPTCVAVLERVHIVLS